MPQDNSIALVGLIAIVIGVLLVMGGLMFGLVTALASDHPRAISIPALVQIVLGVLGSTAGFLLRRGHARAKFILVLVAIGVIANLVVLVSVFLATIS